MNQRKYQEQRRGEEQFNSLGRKASGVKVFGIGLGRTGTKSLTYALHHLGFNVAHYPEDAATYQELTAGNYRFSLLQTLDGITDVTVAPFYPHLDQRFPGSKFILTVRDKEDWLASLEKHWNAHPCFDDRLPKTPETQVKLSIRQFLYAAVFGCYSFSRDRAAYVYDLHVQNVKDYFNERPRDLLVLNICESQGWDLLCPFLEQPLPIIPFPKIQKKEELNTSIPANSLKP